MSSRIPEFIALAEKRFDRKLTTKNVETTATLSTTEGSRTVALPTGFAEPIALFIDWDSGRREMVFVPENIETYSAESIPTYWTIFGSNIEFPGPADAVRTLTLQYIQNLTQSALSDSNTTNWLLTANPDLYLSAALAEGFACLKEWDEAQRWAARADGAIQDINWKSNRSRSQAALRVDPALVSSAGTFDINKGF
jgi:hypothetical protein